MHHCLHDQLGWSLDKVEKQAVREEQRRGAKNLIGKLKKRWRWQFTGQRFLDVGAGYGSLLIELLAEGAEAFAVEPGEDVGRIATARLADQSMPARVVRGIGEALPFPDHHFDYVITLQVLEHVPDPAPVLTEIFRVLKPGGRAYVSCENYLAFREQEYRVPWLPLLPKPIAAAYLKALGRDPTFLLQHVHYTTYPQIWKACARVGFANETYRGRSTSIGHITHAFRVGVRFHLLKPTR